MNDLKLNLAWLAAFVLVYVATRLIYQYYDGEVENQAKLDMVFGVAAVAELIAIVIFFCLSVASWAE